MKQKYQGDVGIIKIDAPDKELQWKKVASGFVVAEGEISGHHHKLVCDPQTLIEIAKDEHGWFIKKMDNREVLLTHDTHETQTITEKGIYFMPIQREFDEIAEKRVLD
jgi:hypothetical protein